MSFGAHFFLAVLEGTVSAFVLALTALGLSLVFGVMRVVNVAHGELFMLGAVIAWWVSQMAGDPLTGFLLALIVGPLIVGAIAIAADWLILKRVDYNPEATIVATIGLLYIIQQSVLILYGPDARAVEAPFYFRVQFPWFGYSGYKLIVAGLSAGLLLATWVLLKKTQARPATCGRPSTTRRPPRPSGCRCAGSTPRSSPWAAGWPPWPGCWWCRSSRPTT